MKQNVRLLPNTLRKVLALLAVSYEKKATPKQGEYGFIAQDVLPVFPNLVTINKDPSRTMSLNYVGMISPIVRALQEVEAKRELDVSATMARVKALKAANDNLVSETQALRAQLKAANENYAELRREVEALKQVGSKQ
jgi:hypothetical protein